MTPRLVPAIEALYEAFHPYPLRPIVEGCPHCVSAEDQADLHGAPLRALTADALRRYAFKALSTWGDVDDLRHFLPRLLELTLDGGYDAIDLNGVIDKLEYAHWRSWPPTEQQAIERFLAALWTDALAYDSDRHPADELLAILARTHSDLSPFLAAWSTKPTEPALRQLAQVCAALGNRPTVLPQVRRWLAKPATRALLEAGFFQASSPEIAAELSDALQIADHLAQAT